MPSAKLSCTILPTLTPASIELIEADASAHYGLRLRYVPDDIEDQAEEPKPKPIVKKKPVKAKLARWPTTFEEVVQAIVGVIKKAPVPVGAEAFHGVLGPDKSKAQKVWERHKGRMISEGIILATGNSRGKKYSLPD